MKARQCDGCGAVALDTDAAASWVYVGFRTDPETPRQILDGLFGGRVNTTELEFCSKMCCGMWMLGASLTAETPNTKR